MLHSVFHCSQVYSMVTLPCNCGVTQQCTYCPQRSEDLLVVDGMGGTKARPEHPCWHDTETVEGLAVPGVTVDADIPRAAKLPSEPQAGAADRQHNHVVE